MTRRGPQGALCKACRAGVHPRRARRVSRGGQATDAARAERSARMAWSTATQRRV